MSLLGLMLGNIIDRKSDQPEVVKRLQKLRGALVV